MKLIRSQCPLHLWLFILLIELSTATHEDCPWYQKDEGLPDELKSNCICATNPSNTNLLSIQCQDVNAQILVEVLEEFEAGTNEPLELLYLNSSRATNDEGKLVPQLFHNLKIVSLQLSGCKIKSLDNDAFKGSEGYLKHLSLSQNEISSIPVEALGSLEKLTLLDLSYNKITRVPKAAFFGLSKLGTLKLNDNSLELHPEAFVGLEGSLRNLNLKGTRISHVPPAAANLTSLAFFDLAQNRIRALEPAQFSGLHSLTALNLERNLLPSLPNNVFEGINDTLSSLSLLNNLITSFPRSAIKNLRELRVLDLGFNLLTEIPRDAFRGLKSLTLLALDGNPLSTLQEESFAILNTTLRGISLGGRFLTCDCRLKWILEWIHTYDLQVTSRERNPQFCGSPNSLRSLSFYQLQPNDLECQKNETIKEPDVTLTQDPESSSGSQEDQPLLEEGSSSVYVSRKESTSSSSSENSGEQKSQDSAQVGDQALPSSTESLKNPSSGKFKPRRNRPVKFTKPTTPSLITTPVPTTVSINAASEVIHPSDTRPSHVNTPESHSSSESQEDPNVGIVVGSKMRIGSRTTSTTTPVTTTTATSTTPSPKPSALVTSSKNLVRPIRPNPVRHRLTPKTVPTTTHPPTIIYVSSSEPPPRRTTSTPTTRATTTPSPTTIPTVESSKVQDKIVLANRSPTSKTIEAVHPDESKISLISGIGSAVSAPNLNTGSIMTVKQPSPVHSYSPSGKSFDSSIKQNQPYEVRSPPVLPPNLVFADKSEIVVHEIVRNGDSIMLHWDSPKPTAGFRIMYRMFGEDIFRQGPPLAPTETDYRLRNIPNNECMVVCVVPYEEILYGDPNPSAASVPPGSQCREVRPNTPSALMNHMDKITIGASVAICVTVLIAVMIFIFVTKRAKSKRPSSASTIMGKGLPPAYLTPSPRSNPLQSGGYGQAMTKDWDQISVISTKSIPRARVFHGSMDCLANNPNTAKSGQFHRAAGPEGFTYRSFSAAHHHHHHNPSGPNHTYHQHQHHGQTSNAHSHGSAATAVNNYLHNQNRLLRTSLGSRASYDALNKLDKLTSSRHSHHHQHGHTRRKRSSHTHLNQSESLHTLNGYDTTENWTDHDMDFYVARNHTRHDLVQL